MALSGTFHRCPLFRGFWRPQRTSSQLWPYGFMPYAAPVRLVADVLAETARRKIARASVNRLTNAPIIARRGWRQPAVRF